jgi:translation initiation factor 1
MSDEKKPFNNAFAGLGGLREALPAGPVREKKEKPPPARAVVRLERKGRAGKEVTVIEHLELPVMEREVWLKALKSALGCGGVIEGDALVLQGDQRERAPAVLTARGVRKVTVAN